MKIFIVTDERCGGTVFTRIFNDVFNMKTIDDPQTGVNRKFPNYNKKDNLLDYLFNTLNYEVVKCCFCSFTNEEYFKLLDYCKINKVKIIVLYRENAFDRALSIAVARTLRNKIKKNNPYSDKSTVLIKPFGYKDTDLIKPYNLNLNIYESEIKRYKYDYNRITTYLNIKEIDHFHITFDQCYIDSERINNFKKLFSWLNLDCDNLEDCHELNCLLNKDYNTKEANKLILNFDEVIEINSKYL